ncbi:MAG: ATP-dependent Clp protease ATP-binding subunit [Bacteroidaceae bacterium]|nr:ATP-dependent Clp protease ATP-binding subunit [Bacteroidaceae bacterium]
MTARFSPDMTYVLSFSREEAQRLHNDSVTPVHLMLGILRHTPNHARDFLQRLQPDLTQLKSKLENIAHTHQVLVAPAGNEMNFNDEATRIMRLSVLEARQMKSDVIDTEHILLAIMRMNDNEASNLLEQMNISYEDVARMARPQTDTKDGYGFHEDEEDEEEEDDTLTSSTSAAQTSTQTQTKKGSGNTPVLDNFGTDLTHAAEEGLLDPVVGRLKEIERVAQILSRRKKNNPILIGHPGVGKSAIVEGLATRIVKHQISRHLWGKRVIVLDMASVVAGTKYRGQFEERIRSIILELQKNPDVIIFIDEIHTIVGAGSAPGSMDAANMLKPALARGEIQCIGATTIDEYRKSIEKDGALERRFQKVLVDPTTPEQTLQILQNLKGRYEEHHHVNYTPEALQACVDLTERYITDRSFPDKAIDVMDEAGSRIHIQDTPVPEEIQQLEQRVEELQTLKNESVKNQNFELAADYRDQLKQVEESLEMAKREWENNLGDERVTVDEFIIADVVSAMTGIPVQRMGNEENTRLRNLKQALQQSVIGQDEAINTLVRAIQRGRVGLKDPNKPIGAFMFVGPTGVGKTYLTKCLAEELFGSADNIIRIDMSEYMEKHTVSRMVGAPPGYVGYEEGGQLTEKVRRKPYSIVLLDEIEKAHPDVFNILLQVMDEGRLTDGNGTTVDFKNTIIVMTSNCGTRQIKEFGHGVGFSSGEDISHNRKLSHDLVKKQLQKQFAPEFLNRLDNIIYFDQLDQEAINQIVNIELKPLIHRLNDLGYTLEIAPDVKDFLGQKGYDVQFGARPLRRAIQNYLEDPLCEYIMEGIAAQQAILATMAESGDSIELKPQEINV